MESNYFTTTSIVSSNRILYTPSTFARSSLLHLQEVGELTARQPHTSTRSNLSSYLFFMVLSGSGELVYNGKKYELDIGDCVFIDCEKAYSHATSPDNLWTLRWIHFYGPTLPAVYEKYCERGGRPTFTPAQSTSTSSSSALTSHASSSDVENVLKEGQEGQEKERKAENVWLEKVEKVWSELMTTASSDDYMRDMLINQHLSTLLTLIMEQSWHPEDQYTTPKKQIIKPVKDFLDENYGSKITLDELAYRFYINKYYMARVFKAQYGVSIMAYLQSIRITKAKQMLRFTEKSVEEIGYEVGLGAPAYFSRVFKNVEGVSPKTYREQW